MSSFLSEIHAGTILVVDGDAAFRGALSDLVGRRRSVVGAECGAQALALLRTRHRDVSLVVLDLALPDMTGWELWAAIDAEHGPQAVPVVVTAASAGADDELQSLERGAVDFIGKPCDPAILERRIDNVMSLLEARRAVARMERDAHTGLYSLQSFLMRAGDYLGRHASENVGMVLVSIRHAASLREKCGEEVLSRMVRLISDDIDRSCEGGALTGQYGLHKVVALIPHRYDPVGMMRMLNARVAGLLDTYDTHLVVGAYLHVDRRISVGTMCSRAEMALDEAGSGSSWNVAQYTEALDGRLREEADIDSDFSRAITGKEFEIWFQPKCSPVDGTMVGAEALVRWRRAGTLVPPGRFIPLLERSGKIRALDRHVFARVCAGMAEWRRRGLPVVPVSVNLSRRTMRDHGIARSFLRIAESCGIAPALVPIEVTETATESAETVRTLGRALHEAGFPLHMDDFGTGASSLASLSDLHFDTVKVDRSLVDRIGSSVGDIMMRHVVVMARELGLHVVAEGVESASQVRFLRGLGTSSIQGYYYSRPLPEADFLPLLACGLPLRTEG